MGAKKKPRTPKPTKVDKGVLKKVRAAKKSRRGEQMTHDGMVGDPPKAPKGNLRFMVFSTPGKRSAKSGDQVWNVRAKLLPEYTARRSEAAELCGASVYVRPAGSRSKGVGAKVLRAVLKLAAGDIATELTMTGDQESHALLGTEIEIEPAQDGLDFGGEEVAEDGGGDAGE